MTKGRAGLEVHHDQQVARTMAKARTMKSAGRRRHRRDLAEQHKVGAARQAVDGVLMILRMSVATAPRSAGLLGRR